MSNSLRFGLLFVSFLALVSVIITITKNKLNIKYSIVWIVWALFSLLLAIFPKPFYKLSKFIGIELPVNAIFLIMIGLLYALTFYSYLMLSKHNNEITSLTYEVARLKKQIDELKNK